MSPKVMKLVGKHVVVTGGSLGIGKAVAIEAAKRGANVTLMARNKEKLAAAESEVKKHMNNANQGVLSVSVDLGKDYNSVEAAVKEAEKASGTVDVLVNSAGIQVSSYFEETPPETHQAMMNVNYFGSMFATRAVLPGMRAQRSGRIVFVSSMAGQVGIFGYHGYAASKFALRGFAEALQMEVKPDDIYLTIAYPPDTDTPGLAEENLNKPKETKLIADTAGLQKPDVVARKILDSAERGDFNCYFGFLGYLATTVTSGMGPASSISQAIQQIFFMGFFRFISLLLLWNFNGTVKKARAGKK